MLCAIRSTHRKHILPVVKFLVKFTQNIVLDCIDDSIGSDRFDSPLHVVV